jgi:hypothetical protein
MIKVLVSLYNLYVPQPYQNNQDPPLYGHTHRGHRTFTVPPKCNRSNKPCTTVISTVSWCRFVKGGREIVSENEQVLAGGLYYYSNDEDITYYANATDRHTHVLNVRFFFLYNVYDVYTTVWVAYKRRDTAGRWPFLLSLLLLMASSF